MHSGNNHKSRPIFVLGVDRSGTSLVSEITHEWGAYAGDPELLASANEGNPQGYWEYEPMEEFVNKLFDSVEVSHWDATFSTRMKEKAFQPELRNEALDLIAKMEKGPAWFWKEPYLSLCMAFWEEILEDPIYIVPVRNPNDSAKSYEKFSLPPTLREGVRLKSLFFLRWQYFMLSILEHASRNPSKVFLSYEKLLQSPVEQCERLCRFLDRECRIEEFDKEKVHRMSKVVNPDLWRNRDPVPLTQVPQATEAQRELYDLLLRKIEDPDTEFDAAKHPMVGWWREYMDNVDLMLGLFNIA